MSETDNPTAVARMAAANGWTERRPKWTYRLAGRMVGGHLIHYARHKSLVTVSYSRDGRIAAASIVTEPSIVQLHPNDPAALDRVQRWLTLP